MQEWGKTENEKRKEEKQTQGDTLLSWPEFMKKIWVIVRSHGVNCYISALLAPPSLFSVLVSINSPTLPGSPYWVHWVDSGETRATVSWVGTDLGGEFLWHQPHGVYGRLAQALKGSGGNWGLGDEMTEAVPVVLQPQEWHELCLGPLQLGCQTDSWCWWGGCGQPDQVCM